MDNSLRLRFALAEYWIPFLLWMAVIFFFSHMDGESSGALSDWIKGLVKEVFAWLGWEDDDQGGGNLGFWVRKAAHAFEYGLLFFLGWRVLRQYSLGNKTFWMVWAFCWVYASLDEWHQSFVPGRTATPMDVGVDMIGATLSLLGCWLWWGRKKDRQG